jgi:hypothetical protein
MTYRHFLTYAIGAPGKIWRKLNFMQVIIEYMCGQMIVCIYNGDQLKSTLQHTWTWSAVVWPPCHLCYHPAAFLCHLHLIMPLLPQEKIQHMFHKDYLISATLWLAMLTCAFKLHGGNFNGYPTNAPSPLKSPTYERTKKFKCPVHSCRSLVVITPLVVCTLYNGLWSDSRSCPLPNNVLMNVMNSIF